jgi:hypothetical protein
VNPVGLAPSRIDQLAEALGWSGQAVDRVRLLDTEVAVVLTGAVPRGILVPVGASWRRALSVARACLPIAPSALAFGAGTPSDLCLLECGYAEVGLVTDAGVLLVARQPRPSGSQRRSVDRVFARQLADQLAARSSRPAVNAQSLDGC